MKKTGIFIIIIGLALTVFTAFTFASHNNVIENGKAKINNNMPQQINWSPLLGIALMGIGGVALWQTFNKKESI